MGHNPLTSAYKRLYARLFAGSSRYVGDDEAADILQDAFVKLWGRHYDLSEGDQAEGLLATTVRRLTVDSLRRKSRLAPEEEISEPTPDEESDYVEIYERVDEIITLQLGERDREIFLRRDRDGWEFEDIADHFGLSEANVRLIVSRARRKVRTIYNRQYE